MRALNGKTYESRNRILRQMGFKSYFEYLKSDLWKRIRAKVFKVKGRRCFLCGDYAFMVHHNRYNKPTLLGALKQLHPICAACHRKIEFSGDTKVNLNEAMKRFKRLRKDRAKTEYLVKLFDYE